MIDELAQTYAHYVALRRELSLWVEQSIRRDGPDQLMGTCEIQGAVVPLVEWAEGHLPEQILALLQPPVGRPGTVLFYNGGEERQALEWRMAGTTDWQCVELAPSEVREYPLE